MHNELLYFYAVSLSSLEEKEIPAVQRGDYTGGRYAYVDSAPALGVILELLESTDTD